MTLRFVILIATPLCLVNSLLFSLGLVDFWEEWAKRFLLNYTISFPQAILYVTLVKWYNRRKLN